MVLLYTRHDGVSLHCARIVLAYVRVQLFGDGQKKKKGNEEVLTTVGDLILRRTGPDTLDFSATLSRGHALCVVNYAHVRLAFFIIYIYTFFLFYSSWLFFPPPAAFLFSFTLWPARTNRIRTGFDRARPPLLTGIHRYTTFLEYTLNAGIRIGRTAATPCTLPVFTVRYSSVYILR